MWIANKMEYATFISKQQIHYSTLCIAHVTIFGSSLVMHTHFIYGIAVYLDQY